VLSVKCHGESSASSYDERRTAQSGCRCHGQRRFIFGIYMKALTRRSSDQANALGPWVKTCTGCCHLHPQLPFNITQSRRVSDELAPLHTCTKEMTVAPISSLNTPLISIVSWPIIRNSLRQTEIEQGLTSHQTHYRSYRGRVSTGQMTQPTVSKHWMKKDNSSRDKFDK